MGYPAEGGPGIGPADTGGVELDPVAQPPQLALLPSPAPAAPDTAAGSGGRRRRQWRLGTRPSRPSTPTPTA